MSRGPKREKRPADVIGASCQNGLGGGVAGAIVAAIVGLIKNKMMS